MEETDYNSLINRVNITTTIELNLKRLAEQYKVKISDALDFGLRFKLAEQGILEDYPTNQLLTNIAKLQERLVEANDKITELELLSMKDGDKPYE